MDRLIFSYPMNSAKVNYISGLLPYVFSSVLFYAFLIQMSVVFVATFLFLLFIVFIDLTLHPYLNKKLLLTMCFIGLVLSLGLLKVDHGLSGIFYYFSELLVFFLSWYATREPQQFYKGVKLVLYSFLIYVFTCLWIYQAEHEPLSYIISGSSQNGVPSYLIVLLVTFLFCRLIIKGDLPLIPAFLTVVVSFYGEGRGSMIISLLILAICLLHTHGRLFREGIRKGKFYFILFFFVLIGLIFSFDQIADYVVSHTKLSVGIHDSHRLNIVHSYVNSLDLTSIFIGKGYAGTIVETEYAGNPHIAYIRLHSFFGIIPVLLVTFSPFLLVLNSFSRKNLYLFAIISCVLLRALSEPILFPTFLDYFYFSCYFLFFRIRELKKCKKTQDVNPSDRIMTL